MTSNPTIITQNAILANLTALNQRLQHAAVCAYQASEAMANGEQNMAIGTILDLERILPEAQALFDAAIALHRGSR